MTTPAHSTATPDVQALTAPAAQVEAYLEGYLDTRPIPGNLREAISYAVLAPGKRMRPILVIRSCEAVGGSIEQALPPAAAIELIHAFSLVHDDLPAMDDDDLRRGRPTLHRQTSEAMAILAGDAMTSLAFDLILTQVADAELAGRICHELASATTDMISGQVYDTLGAFDDQATPMQRLTTIHKHKTAALMRASCRMGGLCGQADESQLQALTDYAQAIGLMFQVVDDLLDVTQSTEHLGKTAGKDADQHKLTWPGLCGVDATRAEVQRLHNEARQALERFGDAAAPLNDLCDFLAVRTK